MSIFYLLDPHVNIVRYVYNLQSNTHYYKSIYYNRYKAETIIDSTYHRKIRERKGHRLIKQTKLTQLIYNIPDLDWNWKINV